MPLTVFLAVLFAAALHAGWNAIIKTGLSKQSAMMLMSFWQGAIGLAILVWLPFPAPEVWPWLFASGLIHTAYQLFLAYAYEQGDLSRVYPIARGAAPLIVLVVSLAILNEPVAGREYAGIGLLGLGIALMARGVFTSGESRRLLPFALGSAVATAGYSIVDGLGARVSGAPLAYVCWLLLLAGIFYVPVVLALKGSVVLRAPMRDWGAGAIAAAASLAAYAIAVWAMTFAPIALVTALRETSILFAVLIGWLIFGERMTPQKWMAAGLIVAGVAMTRL